MHDWQSFLLTADQWLICYASVPAELSSVTTFSIGHAVELYLKATYTKNTGNINKAIKCAHSIKGLWDACKNYDVNFMPNYEIKEHIFNINLFEQRYWEALSKDDLEHFLENQELYLIAKLLPDLKYLGAPLKSIKGAFSFSLIHPNDYWIRFFKEFRGYLRHPLKDRLDFIKHKLDEGDLPDRSVKYLQQLYT